MASRIQLKYGLVSEQERLSNSADALLVTEPTTGSKARTKGSLYLIVASRSQAGRAREACRLVADSIRRDYYYDESAGIAICLEKSIRSANRRLRHAREGGGLAPGSLGVAAAVVRGSELYVATAGEADAYLVRAARLLMPEQQSSEGLPADDNLRVDVWRGDFGVGDSLVLCSRNLVEVVGTEELKNAVVTLHPQSAVEHLHHLFVAAGGDGSDAVLAIEATEVALSRVEHRLVPVSPSEPLAGAPERSPIPLADQFSGAATAVQDRAVAARSALGDSVNRAVAGLQDLLPHRRTTYRRISPATSRREAQRRAAMAVLSFLGVVAVLGVGLWYWGGPLRGREDPRPQVTAGEAAYQQAQQKVSEVESSELLVNDPARAQRLLKEAWADLERAETAEVDVNAVAGLRQRVGAGLDMLYGTHRASAEEIYAAPAGAAIGALTLGPVPDEAYYLIVDRSIVRVDPQTGRSTVVVNAGDGSGAGIGAPRLLARGGLDLDIVDVRGELWRWRPADAAGSGTLGGSVSVGGDQVWGRDVVDIDTFLIDPDRSLYRLYVPHPTSRQILRYEPSADGGGFSAPTPYFVSEGEDVVAFRQIIVDGDVYALTADELLRYFNGRRATFELAEPPDADDLREGVGLRLMAATGTRGVGRLYIWDARHQRVLVYEKADGAYVEQFVAAEGQPAFNDVRGMIVVERGEVEPPILVWADAQRLYRTVLEAAPGASPEPSPGETSGPTPRVTPTGPTPEPTERPRRTPRETPQP